MASLNAFSMFSGMGGDSLGLQNAGVHVTVYNEKETFIQGTHEANFQKCTLMGGSVNGDITKVTDEEMCKYANSVDVIFSGFPCQGFSNAGKKKTNDPRNTLFREFVRATKLLRPNIIIGENVKGLLSRRTEDGQKYIDVIVNEFRMLGYVVDYKVCRATDFGVPQKRDRLIIIGVHISALSSYRVEFPQPITNVDLSLRNILQFNMYGAIRVEPEVYDFTQIPEECILTDMSNHETENHVHPYLRLKAESRDAEYKGKVFHGLLSFSKRDSPIHCEIVDIRKPSKTIICTYSHQPRLFVPLRNANGNFLRCLLPDELKQIQGFPRDYFIHGNMRQKIIQIGNAVPPPMITHIVSHMMNGSNMVQHTPTPTPEGELHLNTALP